LQDFRASTYAANMMAIQWMSRKAMMTASDMTREISVRIMNGNEMIPN